MKKILILSIICYVSNTFAMEKNSEDIDVKTIKTLLSDTENYKNDINHYIESNKTKIIAQINNRINENHPDSINNRLLSKLI